MNRTRNLILPLALLLLAIPSIAAAQEEVVDVSETITLDEEGNDSDVANLDPEDPLYWARMRDIYTYQQKSFLKDGRFAASVYFGVIPNNIFERYIPVGLRLDYYVAENIAIELAGAYTARIPTSLVDNIKDPTGIGADNLLVGDSQVMHANIAALWSPLYGKTSWYQSTINYFDVYLVGGLGVALVRTQADFSKPQSTDVKIEGVVGAGVNFFFTEHVLLRLDYRQFIFKKAGSGITTPSEVSVAIGWMF